ncbi:tetratricopeptide repeat protein [Leptothoe spongobia]|uniref:Tetratricopeptide repeat protein n=1 Tax=Leptothoe spongobia TAU-MAC 1115 TaxID=1967444 RepID=A0A947GIH4_9CYAN|nr:tetratricopeptide repeat protein [Leptothoe spongobia]MBT9316195.1 tetratricopeptide repeat protein [Leptothoe spongobia TAU-MAC 1115]
MIETPFDLSYHYDDNLQDVPNNSGEMQQAIDFWQAQLDQPGLEIFQRIKLLGRIGGYARTLRNLDRAEQALSTALTLSKAIENRRFEAANSIKLAHVYQWQQRYVESETMFEAVITLCQNDPEAAPYLDFAYQHFGKCKFDQQKYAEALQCFEQALNIRMEKGDSELIASTELAIATTHSRQKCHDSGASATYH